MACFGGPDGIKFTVVKNAQSPGRHGWLVLLMAFAVIGQPLAQIQIAEIDAVGDLTDGLGRGEDWIELVNVGEGTQSGFLNTAQQSKQLWV